MNTCIPLPARSCQTIPPSPATTTQHHTSDGEGTQLTQIHGLLTQLSARFDALTMPGGRLVLIQEQLQSLSAASDRTTLRLDELGVELAQVSSCQACNSSDEEASLRVSTPTRNRVSADNQPRNRWQKAARQVLSVQQVAQENFMAENAHDAVFGEAVRQSSEQAGEPQMARFVALPGQGIRMWWDIVSVILVLFICLTLPYRLAFIDEWSLFLTLIDLLIDVFFLVRVHKPLLTPVHRPLAIA